jgi:hypothetical protein
VNWRVVRDGYDEGSVTHHWFTRTFGDGDSSEWSRYATDLYLRLGQHAARDGWLPRLRYMLYEHAIAAQDARRFEGTRFEGVLLQTKTGEDGLSANPHIAAAQQRLARGEHSVTAPPSVWERLLAEDED